MDYSLLLAGLEGVLGKSYKRARDNYAFKCPSCNHRKPKLEINLKTNHKGENPWECWVCGQEGMRGRTVHSLLKKINTPKNQAVEVLQYVKKTKTHQYKQDNILELPKGFTPLYKATTTSVLANKYKKYLYDRGLNDNDIIKYNIGYCRTGKYQERVIIPSYSQSNTINYFVARYAGSAYIKYKNPQVDKDIIFFENLINWSKPIIICEGVFDAMAIKRNAIPVLGKKIPNSLKLKIIQSDVEDIYIALDQDALKVAISYCQEFINLGKNVYLINLKQQDPAELGFEKFTQLVQSSEKLQFSDLMKHKIKMI